MTHYYVSDNAPKARAPRSTGSLQFHLFSKPREHCVTSCILRSVYSGSTSPLPPPLPSSTGSAFLCDTHCLNSAQSRLRQLYLLLLIADAIISPACARAYAHNGFRNVCITCTLQYFLRYALYQTPVARVERASGRRRTHTTNDVGVVSPLLPPEMLKHTKPLRGPN